METKILFATIILGVMALVSCSKDTIMDEPDQAASVQTSMETRAQLTKGIELTNFDLGELVPLRFNPDSMPVKNSLKSISATQSASSTQSISYNYTFHDNLYALDGIQFTIKARSNGKYLSSNGKNNELVFSTTNTAIQQKFYFKSNPYGSAYIYSAHTNTPLVVGYYTNKPAEKIIFIQNDNTNINFYNNGIIVEVSNFPRYLTMKSEGLMKTGSGGFEDYYNEAMYVTGDKIRFSRYSGSSNYEFQITPDAVFPYGGVDYVYQGNAKVEYIGTFEIYDKKTNTDTKKATKVFDFKGSYMQWYQYIENEGINFLVGPASRCQQAYYCPYLSNGEIVFDPPIYPQGGPYFNYFPMQKITWPVNFDFTKTFNVNARTELTVTNHFSIYELSTDYELPIYLTNGRTTKLTGVWKTRICVDEGIEADYFERNIDTGQTRSY